MLTILKEKGYKGTKSSISVYINRNNINRNFYEIIKENSPKYNTLTNSSVIKLIYKNYCNLKEDEVKNLDKLMEKYPEIFVLRNLIEEFKNLFKGNPQNSETWLKKAKVLDIFEINAFVSGIERDINAVKNSFISIYTNSF